MNEPVRFGETYAILEDSGAVNYCGKDKYQTWYFLKKGQKKSVLQLDSMGDRIVSTTFEGVSRALDGSHKFFRVSLIGCVPTKSQLLGYAFSGKYLPIGTPRFENLEEALAASPPLAWSADYESREEALQTHQKILKHLKAQARRAASAASSDLYEQFLFKLKIWCEQARGHQTALAKQIGTTPQTVNDWLARRKMMTGAQVLRVQKNLSQKGDLPPI